MDIIILASDESQKEQLKEHAQKDYCTTNFIEDCDTFSSLIKFVENANFDFAIFAYSIKNISTVCKDIYNLTDLIIQKNAQSIHVQLVILYPDEVKFLAENGNVVSESIILIHGWANIIEMQ